MIGELSLVSCFGVNVPTSQQMFHSGTVPQSIVWNIIATYPLKLKIGNRNTGTFAYFFQHALLFLNDTWMKNVNNFQIT